MISPPPAVGVVAAFRLLLSGCGGELALAAGLSLASGVLDVVCMMALPFFLMFALSGGTHVQLPDWLARWGLSATPASLSWAIAILFLVRGAFAIAVGSRLAALAQEIRARIVARLAQSFASVSFERAATRSVDEAVSVATWHVSHFTESGVMSLLRLTLDLFTIAAILVFLLLVEPQFVLGTAAVLTAVGVLNFTLIRRVSDTNAHRQSVYETRLAQEVTLSLSAPREVRILKLDAHLRGRMAETLRHLVRTRAWFGAVYWLPRVIGELTLIGLAIGFMLRRSEGGADPLQVVSNLGVLAYAGVRLLPAFAQVLASVSQARAAGPSARALSAILSEPLPVPSGGMAALPSGPLRELALRHVTFRYASASRPSLHGVSLTLRAGESVGVMGPSGAGKSTLADLVMGLLVPTEGEIAVDGTSVTLSTPAWWDRVGFVAQIPFIANDTLRRNIAFGVPEADIDAARLDAAIRMAQLEQVVAKLAQGLETPLGERGGVLSGGQRQRVAIARALYRRCQLLILDEATSALDPQTEAEVIQAIARLKGEVTMLVIAHRATTLAACDRILELRDGRIVREDVSLMPSRSGT